jgi:type IV pilus assembly protein PilA
MWINKRIRDERGFTLIELMVVVLIIAILIAIAIPTFLGARRRAQNRQAQSNLRNGLTSEKTYYADAQVYTNSSTDLGLIESNLAWGNEDAAARGVVVQGVSASGQHVTLRSLSKAGVMFCIGDVAQNGLAAFDGMPVTAGTYYAKVDPGAAGNTCTSGWGPTTASW